MILQSIFLADRKVVRESTHDRTYNTATGELVPDLVNHTQDVKTPGLIHQKKHLTTHAYLFGENHVNNYAVEFVKPKTRNKMPIFEEDIYRDSRRNKFINNWDVNLHSWKYWTSWMI